jgi:tRNA C32,U32 (ribose-2'-O)-methylase TrmJ
LRRMIRRMKLNADDTDMWLGMLRQMAWKLRANKKSDE